MASKTLKETLKELIFSMPWQTKLQVTLPAEKVSVVLHEPAILGGYRVPHQPWIYYIYSLFQLHNETVNVWTHLVGCCVILHQLYGYFDEFDLFKDHVLTTLFMFGISCLISLFTSATVHLLHAKSSYVHFVAFMGDYIGATFSSFGFGIAMFYGMSQKQFYDNWKDLFLPCLTIVTYLNFLNLCMAKIWYGHDPHNLRRKYMFIGGMFVQALMNMSPFVPRYFDCLSDDKCSLSSLNTTTAMTVIFILEAITFAAHQPEKTWPGKFDVFGHGHQIFHVLIVINKVLQFDGVYSDYKKGLNHGEPCLLTILLIMVGMYGIDVLTLMYLKRYVPGCLKRVKDAELKEH